LVLCIVLVIRKHSALRGAQQCEGIVIGHDPRSGNQDGTTYALKIAYKDQNGGFHSFTTKSSSNPPSKPIGQKLIVFHYSDGTPADVLVFQHLFLGYWIWLCLGICVSGCFLAPRILDWLYVR